MVTLHTTNYHCLTIDKKLLCDPQIRNKVCPNISLVQLKQMCSLYESEEEECLLSEVKRSLMRDPKFKATDNLLMDITCITIVTNSVHHIELKDLLTISFSKTLAQFVVKDLKYSKSQ